MPNETPAAVKVDVAYDAGWSNLQRFFIQAGFAGLAAGLLVWGFVTNRADVNDRFNELRADHKSEIAALHDELKEARKDNSARHYAILSEIKNSMSIILRLMEWERKGVSPVPKDMMP